MKDTLFVKCITYSSYDIAKVGVYKYLQCPDFEILLFAYSYGDGIVRVIDLASGERIPDEVFVALTDLLVNKIAFNATFEMLCLERYFNLSLVKSQWQCVGVKSAYLGLPLSLDGVAKCLKLPISNEDKLVVNYFSMPCKPTSSNMYRTRNMPLDHNLKWQLLKSYCRNRVLLEKSIYERLLCFTIPESEVVLWQLDQEINSRGIMVNKALIENAIEINNIHEEKLKNRLQDITGIENPKSVMQLKEWINHRCNANIDDLSKGTVAKLLAERIEAVEENKKKPRFNHGYINSMVDDLNEEIISVLEIRQELSKTSIKKYEAMERSLCDDGRLRGLLQFYGANRTGRWAGRLVQVHNLPQNKIGNLKEARALVESGDYEALERQYESTPAILSQLIRTAFVPEPGCRFICADFNSIEARILAWLSFEKWRIEMFRKGQKLYEMSAARMFNVDVETITKDSPLRQSGKIAELALGYQGGKGALIAMGALDLGLKESELNPLVMAWRDANLGIVKLWRTVEKAAINAVKAKRTVEIQYGIKFIYNRGILFIKLPSGRMLSYIRAQVERDKSTGADKLTYEGMDQSTKQWKRLTTYGGKLTENIVQAIARDCLAHALVNLDKNNYKTVIHIHDEVVLEVPYGTGSVDDVTAIMAEEIPWAKGLVLRAEGFEGEFYRK